MLSLLILIAIVAAVGAFAFRYGRKRAVKAQTVAQYQKRASLTEDLTNRRLLNVEEAVRNYGLL